MLQSDMTHGLPGQDNLEDRANEFGRNWMPVPDPKTWVQLFIDSFDDTTLIILIVSAVVSLGVSAYHGTATTGVESSLLLYGSPNGRGVPQFNCLGYRGRCTQCWAPKPALE